MHFIPFFSSLFFLQAPREKLIGKYDFAGRVRLHQLYIVAYFHTWKVVGVCRSHTLPHFPAPSNSNWAVIGYTIAKALHISAHLSTKIAPIKSDVVHAPCKMCETFEC